MTGVLIAVDEAAAGVSEPLMDQIRRCKKHQSVLKRGGEADELRCVWRLSVFNFPHISLGLIDGREQSVNIFIVVISKKRRLLVARLRKYRPPSPQYSSLSKSRAFPLRLGPLPAFGPAMIEEGTEAKACMCNHEHIRWELKAHFFKRVCVSPARRL